MSELTLLAQDCRDRLIQYYGEQHHRLMSLGRAKNPDLYERVRAVLREEVRAANERRPDPTPESLYLSLVDEKDGITPAPVSDADSNTIWFHGGRSYSMTGKDPITVSHTFHNVLQAFLKSDKVLYTPALQEFTANPSKTMKDLSKKMPVRLPQCKGDGYFARVKPR